MDPIKFESILAACRDDPGHISIENIEIKNNRCYFRINGHLFSTFGSYVYHENDVLFAHPISDLWSRRENDAEGIIEHEKQDNELQQKMDLWDKHKVSLYKLIFLKAVAILAHEGEDKFEEFIDYHFFITEEGNNCNRLLQMLEEKTTDNL